MPIPEDPSGRGRTGGPLRVGGSTEIGALYPHLYFASLPAVADLAVTAVVDAVLRSDDAALPATSIGPAPSRPGPQVVAQLVLSLDPPHRFDPELSMREPLELQVWPDGAFSVEIEFVGEDVRTSASAAESIRPVLTEWVDARGWRLTELYNDRGRSLPDIWNARFVMLDPSGSVGDAVGFAERATRVAESHRFAGESVARLVELLRAGEPDGLLGTPATVVFEPRPAPDLSSEDWGFDIASAVCAFANSVPGGLLVLGLDVAEGHVCGVSAFNAADAVTRLQDAVARTVFPPPEGLLVEAAPVRAEPDTGIILILVPAQDRVLKPFLVHGAVLGDRLRHQAFSLVERRDTTIYAQGIVALHAQLAAGRALLRRETDAAGGA
jgi:hypothetical protein